MKTCISTYSFSRLISSGAMNHFDVLDKIHELGVPAAELVLDDNTSGGSPLEFACRLADQARRLGLDVPIYTTGANFCCPDVEAEIRRVERHIDIAAEAGIPLLRHDITPGFYEGYTGLRTFEAILPTLAAAIREVADYAQKKGVTTCSENHGRLVQDSDRMLAVFTAVNHPNYRYLCDIGNFGGVDENCAAAVSKLLPLISHVHAKDSFVRDGMRQDPGRGWLLSRAGNYRRATIFGHGDQPAYQCLKIIYASGYRGYVSLEFEGMEDTLTAISISMENLNRYLAQIMG